MIEATKGMPVTLVCNTVELSDDKPKADVVSAIANIFAVDEIGNEIPVIALIPMTIKTGSVVGVWGVPVDLPHDAGFVEYLLVDANGEEFIVREDIAFRAEAASAIQLEALTEMALFLYESGNGSWSIDRLTGILTYYKTDGVTVLARWQLLDKFGEPTRIPGNAYGRRRLA